MAMWNRCAICGRAIPVGELCYGIKNWHGEPTNGDTICSDCLVPENALTLTPPNEPLTPEQLREMKDEPAYLKVFDPLLQSGWHIIKEATEDKIIFRGWGKVYVPIDSLGLDYNLYRRPPEGEA